MATRKQGWLGRLFGRSRTSWTRSKGPSRASLGRRLAFEPLENRQLLSVSVGSWVWNDLNANGVQEAGNGEPGVAGVAVELFSSTDSVVGNADDVSLGTATTNAEGMYSFNGLSEGLSCYLVFHAPSGYIFTAQIVGGSQCDSDPNANGVTGLFTLGSPDDISISHDAGLIAVAPISLTAVSPLGGLVYEGAVSGDISSAGEVDRYTVALDAGQTLSAFVASTGSGLQPVVSITGPDGVLLTAVTASAAGKQAVIQTLPITTAGTYTVTVSSAQSAVGQYSLNLVLNATLESESHGGTSNNTLASAQSLDSGFVTVSGDGQQAAVVGTLEASSRTTVSSSFTISASTRVDIVSDSLRNLLYITTTEGDVLRYSLAARQFLTPFHLGGFLQGADISPDQNTLVVADGNHDANNSWIHVIDLTTGNCQKINFTLGYYEGGTCSVVFADNSTVLLTSDFNGSGSVPWRKVNLATGTATTVGRLYMGSLLSVSADHSTVTYAERGLSPGHWGRFRVFDGNWKDYPFLNVATDEAVASRDASQFVMRGSSYFYIFDESLTQVASIREGTPRGMVYSPVADVAFLAWTYGDHLSAYDTGSWTKICTIDDQATFGGTSVGGFIPGRLKISGDGSTLFATVSNGVRVYDLAYGEPEDWYSISLAAGQSATFGLTTTAAVSPTLELYDSAGRLLTSSTTAANFDQVIGNFVATTAGEYYVLVKGTSGAGTGSADYSLVVSKGMAIDTEANNSLGTAQAIFAAGATGYVSGTSDADDYYRFSVNAGDGVTLRTRTPADGPNQWTNSLDPLLQIYDSNGNVLSSNDNGSVDGRNSVIRYSFATAGEYFIRVSAQGNTSGEYVLEMSSYNITPVASASLNSHAVSSSGVLTATATKSDQDGDPVSLTFVWKVNGVARRTFTSATELTDSFDLAQAGTLSHGDTISVEVTPNDGIVNGAVAVDSARVNTMPSATVSFSSQNPLTNSVLTAMATKSDADGDAVSLTYVWRVNGVVKRTFTSATALNDTFGLSTVGNGDRGDTITVEVTPNDGLIDGMTASDTATVGNTAPLATVALNDRAPTTNGSVTAVATKSDVDGDSVSLTYVWKVNGIVKRTFTSATSLTDTFTLSEIDDEHRGDTITVEVVANDGALNGTAVSDNATVANKAPNVAVSLSNSTPVSNDILTATATTSDVDGDPIRLTYVWKVNDVEKRRVSNTANLTDTFDLSVAGNGDRGDTITVEVTANDGYVDSSTIYTHAHVMSPPEITVLDGTTNIASGQTMPIDFGSVWNGEAIRKTFTIRNDGDVALTLTAPFASTSHFIVSQPGKTSLDPGQTTTFTVTLDTTVAWTGSETVSFESNDSGDEVESPFTFVVSGTVKDGTPDFGYAFGLDTTSVSRGQSVTTDAAENVYVTGYFQGTADFDPGTGVCTLTSAGGNDIYVAKYTASGSLVWARSVGGSGSDQGNRIAVAADGSVYVTGFFSKTVDFDPGSGTSAITAANGTTANTDAFILKLDSTGNFVWAQSQGGVGMDTSKGIAVAADGCVYTIGRFVGTADFDPGSNTYNLTSAGGYDWYVSKLDSAGSFVWAKAWGGTADDDGRGIALSADGNVYITGRFQNTVDFDPGSDTTNLTTTDGTHLFIAKLDSAGNLVWARDVVRNYTAGFVIVGGVFNDTDAGAGIVVGSDGSVYTTGAFSGALDFDPGPGTCTLTCSNAQSDGFVLKLNSAGEFIWARDLRGGNYAPPANSAGLASATASTFTLSGTLSTGSSTVSVNSGTLSVNAGTLSTGSSTVSITSGTLTTASSAVSVTSGTLIYSGTLTAASGTLLITSGTLTAGSVTLTISTGTLYLGSGTIAIGSGTIISGTLTSYYQEGMGIALGPDDSVYTTGTFSSSTDFDPGLGTFNLTSNAGSCDVFVSRLDSSGNFLSARAMGGSTTDCGYGIAVKSDQSVAITGSFAGMADFDPSSGTFQLAGSDTCTAFVSIFSPLSAPTSISLSSNSVRENLPIVVEVGALSANTADAGAGLTYTLVSGVADNTAFSIVGNKLFTNATYTISAKSSYTIRVRAANYAGESYEQDLVIQVVANSTPSTVGGQAWNDVNQNGIQDEGEPAMKGVAVELFISADAVVGNSDDKSCGTAITDTSGNYSFSDLWDGQNYYLVFRTTGGYTFTTQTMGSDRDVDSDPNATGVTGIFTLAPNQTDDTHDAGLVGSTLASGFAFGLSGTSTSRGQSVVTDAAGNVYVTGYFQGTVDFDPGPGVWNLTSAGSDDIYVAKYTAGGTILWARRAGNSNHDQGNRIAVGADGCVYVTGFVDGTVGSSLVIIGQPATTAGSDAFVMKLDSAGNILWDRRLSGSGIDTSKGIAVAADGSVYTIGRFRGTVDFDPGTGTYNLTSAGDYDWYVSKLNSAGNFVWAHAWGGTGDDDGRGIGLSADGDVYITGKFLSTVDFDPGPGTLNLTATDGSHLFFAKLDSAGNLMWARDLLLASAASGTLVLNGSTYDADPGTGLAVGSDGSLCTTGSFSGTMDFDPGLGTYTLTCDNYSSSGDAYVLKLDSAGGFVWARDLRNGNSATDATTSFTGTTTLPNATTIITPSWPPLQIPYQRQEGKGIAVGPDGSVYVTGVFNYTADFDPGIGTSNLSSNADSYDAFVCRLDSAGSFLSARAMGGSGNDYGYGIAIAPDQSVYVTGSFSGTADFDPSSGTYNLTTSASSAGFVVKLGNSSPTVTVTLSGNPQTDNVLTATAVKSDADGDAVSLTYVWKVDGVVRRTCTSATALTDTFDLSQSGNGNRGSEVTVEVLANDGRGNGSQGNLSAVVGNTAPLATVSLSNSKPLTNDILTATVAKSDADSDPVGLTFVWKVNGVEKRRVTNTTSLVDTFNLGLAGNGNTGDTITVEVTPNDGFVDGTTVSATARVAGQQEITVLDGTTVIVCGQTTPIDIGSMWQRGVSPSKTFTIRNDGDQTLTLTAPFASTPHFRVGQPGKTSLAAGESTTFTVTLNTANAWTGSETVLFRNNDADGGDGVESPFTFAIKGKVTALSTIVGWSVIGTGDFNGDGKSDLLWRRSDNSGGVRIWQMDGANLVADLSLPSVPATWKVVGVGDFDGDGKADLLWRRANDSGEARIWKLNGSSVVADMGLPNVPSGWKIVGIGDFDGDKKSDLAWRHSDDSGGVRIWKLNGGSVVVDMGLVWIPATWKVVGVGDFDGDGKADLAWRQSNDIGGVRIWKLDGSTIVADTGLPWVDAGWKIVGIGDFDGDGKSDMAWRRSNDVGGVRIWKLNGGSLVVDKGLPWVNADWRVFALGDFDGDKKVDLVWRHSDESLGARIWDLDGGDLLNDFGLPF